MATDLQAAEPRGAHPLLGASRPRYGEKVIEKLLAACAFLSILITIGIVVALAVPTGEFFATVNPVKFLTGTDWAPLFLRARFGVLPLVTATLVITGVAMAVCLPLGLGAAIYLSEYATPKRRAILKPLLEVLAGIPPVVYGFFALTFISPRLQDLLPFGHLPGKYSALSAGLVMGIMILPTVASLSEDAMTAVPRALREGAYGLGANKMRVSVRVVVPAALSGIVAAFVLGISRAIGETMIVFIVGGLQPMRPMTLNPLEDMQTMTAFIASAAGGDQATGSIGYKTIFAVGATLFVITFIMNMISTKLVRRFREVYE